MRSNKIGFFVAVLALMAVAVFGRSEAPSPCLPEGGQPAQLFTYTQTLSASELNSLDAAPVKLGIPAQGAGKAIRVVSVQVHYRPGTVAFDYAVPSGFPLTDPFMLIQAGPGTDTTYAGFFAPFSVIDAGLTGLDEKIGGGYYNISDAVSSADNGQVYVKVCHGCWLRNGNGRLTLTVLWQVVDLRALGAAETSVDRVVHDGLSTESSVGTPADRAAMSCPPPDH